MAWVPQGTWTARADALLRRLWELSEGSRRYAIKRQAATGVLELTWPHTLCEVNTAAGNVTVTLPDPAAHVGYCVQIAKAEAANTCTIDGANVVSGTVALTAQDDVFTFVSNAAHWRIV